MKKLLIYHFFLLTFLIGFSNIPCILAQRTPTEVMDIKARLAETKWRYLKTIHVESNMTVHEGTNDYEYFLYFKYDFRYEQYLNGAKSNGYWDVRGNILYYTFRDINQFEINDFSEQQLVLKFKQQNGRGNYHYIYQRVEDSQAPFFKPANELPLVTIKDKKKSRKRWWMPWQKSEAPPASSSTGVFINIELIGGGFYGGIDPVQKDFIVIKNDGHVIKEFQTIHKGLIINRKIISRKQLEELAQYIIDQKFFLLKTIYDCETKLCQERKWSDPVPIPLRIAVTYGDRRKVVTAPIWGQDHRQIDYIQYPPELDRIILTIQKIGN